MKHTRKLLPCLALSCGVAASALAAPALRPASNPKAIPYGRRCILPRGSFIAVNEGALRRLFQAMRQQNTPAIVDLVGRYEVERLIRDAVAIPVTARGKTGDLVEVQIPGLLGNVVTPRANLIAR